MSPAPGQQARDRLFDGYRLREGSFDEVLSPTGELHPHYETFMQSLEAMGRHELSFRRDNARRAIRETGVTYNIYGDPRGPDRPWDLDLLPLLLAPAEWQRLERGLQQRATLVNLILADLYGPRQMLREGVLPPALVFGNPGFLRACDAIQVPRGIYLHLHAVDLARTRDGAWRVLADRTQAPSGAGYALENRIVLSRTLPEAFRDCNVERLAGFFRAQRDSLMALAPYHRDQPKIVLLTPGPYNETYFEHAYLARYLGFTLVEGGDLMVRDRRVFIKTLEGLQPVDIIFRRLDDAFCDPLELRSDSSLGVAGLVEAARVGNVTIANALGSGAIETAAIMPFLPALCHRLLGEELALNSVDTWWCGDPAARRYVLEHLDQLVVKHAFPAFSRDPIFSRRLSQRERRALADRITARPDYFVAQEEMALSTSPIWTGQEMEPRPVVLRTYAASVGESYLVMPGGLTRVSNAPDIRVVSMQQGGGSKDTWVLADGPVSHVSLLAATPTVARLERVSTDLPSRVADHLFWLGRHAERAEHILRLLRTAVVRLTDENGTQGSPQLSALLDVLERLKILPASTARGGPASTTLETQLAAFFSHTPRTPLHDTLNELRRISSVVRDRMSGDTWRILSQLQQDLHLRHGRFHLPDVLSHMNRMIVDLAAFSGMEMENMTRGHGWRFLDVGRRIERSVNITTLVRTAIATEAGAAAMLESLLMIADSVMTYRRRYFAEPQLAPVLDLLLADDSNARALAFQLGTLVEHVIHLPLPPNAPSPTREQRIAADAADRLSETDFDALCEGPDGERLTRVSQVLLALEEDLRLLSDAITHFHFNHLQFHVS